MKVEYPDDSNDARLHIQRAVDKFKAKTIILPPSGEANLRTTVEALDAALTISPAHPSPSPPPPRALAELETRKAELLAVAQSITISNQSTYEFAASLRQQVRKASDAIEALLRPNIKRLTDAKQAALDDLKKLRKPLDDAEEAIKKKQDDYNNANLRAQREENARIAKLMEDTRQSALAEEMERAAASSTPAATEQMDAVIERMAQPPTVIPMTPVRAKAPGASGTLVKRFRMIDFNKLDPVFILSAIHTEIAEKGECAWLTTQINKEVRYRGKGAEETVGAGSIQFYEEISTRVRR